jgi:hypothetical protein
MLRELDKKTSDLSSKENVTETLRWLGEYFHPFLEKYYGSPNKVKLK